VEKFSRKGSMGTTEVCPRRALHVVSLRGCSRKGCANIDSQFSCAFATAHCCCCSNSTLIYFCSCLLCCRCCKTAFCWFGMRARLRVDLLSSQEVQTALYPSKARFRFQLRRSLPLAQNKSLWRPGQTSWRLSLSTSPSGVSSPRT
jgi:hypothetical protein